MLEIESFLINSANAKITPEAEFPLVLAKYQIDCDRLKMQIDKIMLPGAIIYFFGKYDKTEYFNTHSGQLRNGNRLTLQYPCTRSDNNYKR